VTDFRLFYKSSNSAARTASVQEHSPCPYARNLTEGLYSNTQDTFYEARGHRLCLLYVPAE
jgi:hypothetical protein